MSKEVVTLRLSRSWLPDKWEYRFDGEMYEVREEYSKVPMYELRGLEAMAKKGGFEVLSRNPFVCRKKMDAEEVTGRMLEEFVVQAGGLGLISFEVQGVILDEILESITKEDDG